MQQTADGSWQWQVPSRAAGGGFWTKCDGFLALLFSVNCMVFLLAIS